LIQSSEATFRRSVDGTVRNIFKTPDENKANNSTFIFQSMMLQLVTKEGKIPIWRVNLDG